MCDGIHPFEKAGLGKAPFQFVGITENWYSVAPDHKQPGGSCDYCGTGIAYEFGIQSVDGKVSKVGCDCIRKLDRADNRLVAAAERAQLAIDKKIRTVRLDAKKAKETARINATFARLNDPMVWERFAAMPHPKGWLSKWQGGYPLSMANYIAWMQKNAFHSGRLEVAKAIEKVLA